MKKNKISFSSKSSTCLIFWKHIVLISGIVFTCQIGKGQTTQPHRCGTVHSVNKGNIQPIELQSPELNNRSVIEIPVVVHVVWNTADENISDEQILSQIDVLNKDFRANNIEIPGIPSVFQSLVADVEIEFCLAKTDPNGEQTDGIIRKFTQNSVGIGGSSNIHYTAQGGSDAWDTERYLNIWVAKFAGGVVGVASFPGDGPAEEQGVEVEYRQFGTINVEPPYHLGRTCTHEIGHYFNLEHPWGPALDDCCEDDFVADTPAACDTYLGECPNFPISSCSGPDMFMNFMFFTNDDCMGMFSLGQKARMLSTLNNERSGLISSGGCLSVPTNEPYHSNKLKILNNPVGDRLRFEIKSNESEVWKIEIFDTLGRVVHTTHESPNQLITIGLNDKSSGVYFLVATKKEQKLASRIILN